MKIVVKLYLKYKNTNNDSYDLNMKRSFFLFYFHKFQNYLLLIFRCELIIASKLQGVV